MNGAEAADFEDRSLVHVSLICISCGCVEDIHVFQARRPPGNMYWECFDCQKRKSGAGGWPEGPANH